MNLLALDSATDACSVALYLDGTVNERFEIAPRRHTQLLLPMVEVLLADAGISLAELDAIAYTRGPGSFTGLRITLGIVQGLAHGLDRPVIGISTLAVLAQRTLRTLEASRVAVAMDARMGQVYWGQYVLDEQGHCTALAEDSLHSPGDVPRLAAGAWQIAGAGWDQYSAELQHASGLTPAAAAVEKYPHAADLAILAVGQAVQKGSTPAHLARLSYLRDKVAEKSNKA